MISDFSLGYGYLPVSWAFFTSFTFLLCYGIAVSQNHIYPFVPAISDTGARVPEANIFSEFFNFSIALMVVNLLIRYLQFGMLTHGIDSSDLLLGRLNKLGLAFGVVSAFGGTIIANFPSIEEDSMVYIHDVGAILLFGSGALYCWVQTSLTYKLTQLGMNSAFLFAVRFILTCVISVFGAIFFIAELFAYDEFRQQSAHAVVQWQPSDPGYGLHVLSNLSEWIAALCFGLFAITFFDEFQRISLNVECKQNREDASRSLVDYSAINEQDEEQH